MQKINIISGYELWLLFGQHAPTTIIGFPDPTIGLLADEIRERTLQAQKSLLEQGIIKLGARQKWVIVEPYLNLTRGVCSSIHTILITFQVGSSPTVSRSYHLTSTQILELREQEPGKYSIGEVKDFPVPQMLLPELPLTRNYPHRDESSVRLTNKNLAKAHSFVQQKSYKKAKNLLDEFFASPEQLERFIEALSEPLACLSIVAFLHHNLPQNGHTRGFSIIVGGQDIWLFRPENEKYDVVRVESISKAELENTVSAFLSSLEAPQ